MIIIPPFGVAMRRKCYGPCDIPRHIKGAEELPFESECEQGALLFLEAPGGLDTHLLHCSVFRA